MNLDQLLTEEIRIEGGFTNRAADHGGATKYGITQRTLSEWLGRPASVAEVRALTPDVAKQIYMRRYVRDPHFDTLPEPITPFVVDFGINSGQTRSIRYLRKVLNEAGFGPLDGEPPSLVDQETAQAAARAQQVMGPWLLKALCWEREQFVRRTAASDPSQQAFLAGWLNRINLFEPVIPS